MLIDITNLLNELNNSLEINEQIIFEEEDLKEVNVRSMEPVIVTGKIEKDSLGNLSLNLNLKGKMILPCSITLNDVTIPIDIDYQNEESLNIIGNSLDIKPIVWENIVTEIPLKVVSPNAELEKQEGEGWKVITGDIKKENEFSKLNDLFKEEEDE